MAKQAQQYKGFIIKKGRDCWGSISFFAYRDGWQHFDAADTLNELKETIDESLGE